MNTVSNNATLSEAVECEVIHDNATAGSLAEQQILMAMKFMNSDDKVELMKQATKILNAKNKRLNKAIRLSGTRVKMPSVRIRVGT